MPISESPLPRSALQPLLCAFSVPGAVSALDMGLGDSWAATEKQLLGLLHTFPEDHSLVYFLLTLRTQI